MKRFLEEMFSLGNFPERFLGKISRESFSENQMGETGLVECLRLRADF